MSNELQEISGALKNQHLKGLEELANEIKQLNVDDEEVLESDFKTFFLPIIDGSVKATDENLEIFLRNIYRVTNSFTRGIKVVDDKTKEELFRLPPIMIDVDDGEEVLKNVSFFRIINAINAAKDNIAARMNGAEKALLKTGKLIKPDDEKLKMYAESLLKMQERYNIKITDVEIPNKEEKTKEITDNKDDDLNEVFDYD